MDELIPEVDDENESQCSSFLDTHLIQIFMVLKLTVLLFYFVSILFKFYAPVKVVVLALLCLADVWYTKNIAGLDLVGMRWSHEINENGEPAWQFYSRPDPYVPDPFESNAFWGFMFGSVFVWAIVFIWSIFAFGKFNVVISLLILALNTLHLILFLNCRSVGRKHDDDLTRELMMKDFEESEDDENNKDTNEQE